MKIYLDNCCYNRPYDDQIILSIRLETEAKLHIQEIALNKRIDLVWSYILDFENRRNPYPEKKREISLWKEIAVTTVEPDDQIFSIAVHLQQEGLKPLDALHIACGIQAECHFFLTVDRGILRKSSVISDIIVLSPIDFLNELEGDPL